MILNILSIKKGIGKYNNDIVNYASNFCYTSSLFNDNIFFDTSDLYEYKN